MTSQKINVARGEAGTTLLEIIIAAAILSIVVGITLSVMITGQKVYSHEIIQGDCEERSRRFLELLADDLAGADGGSLSIANSHTRIDFKVPVDYDNDGDVLAGDGRTIEYGAIDNDGMKRLNYWYRYEFIQEATLNESVDKIDYNMDGQLTKTFASGRIERSVLDTGKNVVGKATVVARSVLLVSAPLDGDVNGDGKTDPLFLRISGYAGGLPVENVVNGNQTLVDVWMGRADVDQHPALANGLSAIRMRNVP